MDPAPQIGGGQGQSLAVLFSLAGTAAAKDAKGFGTELTKQVHTTDWAEQRHTCKPRKEKREEEVPDQNVDPGTDLPLVLPAIVPALNVTQASATTVAPISFEGDSRFAGDESTGISSTLATEGSACVAKQFAANDFPAQRANAAPISAPVSSAATESTGDTGSMQQTQVVPNKPEQIEARKHDDRRSRTVKSDSDSDTAGASIQVPAAASATDNAQASANVNENASDTPILPGSGEVYKRKKDVLAVESAPSQSVSPNAPPPAAERSEQPAPSGVVPQLLPAIPIVTDGAAVNAAPAAIKAGAPEPVVPIQVKGNSAKSALSIENQQGVKRHTDDSDEPKPRVEHHDGSAPLQPATQPDHEQLKATANKVNAEKAPDLVPAMHSTSSTPSAPPKEEARLTQRHQIAQMVSPDVALSTTTPADVVHAVRMFERNGLAEMHIGMRSEALGTIDVRATVHDGNVGVSIGVERHEIRSALISELPGLENTLRERDMRLGEVKFHDMGSALASEYGNGQQRQAQEFSGPFASAFYRDTKGTSEANDLPIEMLTNITWGGISVHV